MAKSRLDAAADQEVNRLVATAQGRGGKTACIRVAGNQIHLGVKPVRNLGKANQGLAAVVAPVYQRIL